jgi:hypothetical protein
MNYSATIGQLWLAGGALILAMAVLAHNPTLKRVHQRIVALRAAWLLAREMWDGAMTRRNRWSECYEKAKRDV